MTLAITSLSRRWVPAYRQRAYTMLFAATFLATLAERIETFLQMFPSPSSVWYHPAEMLCGSVYFIAHMGTGFCYLLYIKAVLDIYIDFRKFSDFVGVLLAYIAGIILIIINIFVPIVFYYDENGLYNRGPLVFVFYLFALYYIGYGFYLLIRYKKLMRRRTRMVILSYVGFIVVGMIIQYFYPTVLIENLFTVISISLVYISLQNPTEMVDEHLNILNRKAFLEGLDLKTNRKSPHSTIFLTVDNISALSEEMGYTQTQDLLRRISKYLKSVGTKELRIETYTYRYSENVFAVSAHTNDREKTESLLQAIAARLQEPWVFSNMAIKVEGHCFLLRYPEHYSTSVELMGKVDFICDNVENEVDVIIDANKDIYKNHGGLLDYDLMVRKNLDEKKIIVKFQPVLSKVYKINYTADVVCYFYDECGNEIDPRGHIPDIRVTQALMDADEYAYRIACRSLNFWNAGDRNGKYRAVVGMSQGEISRHDFLKRIKKILREERAEASWITLKLTETTITTMNPVAERNLKMMAEMKSYIIVDKFGSGYGDLDRILSLPVIEVNIDHSILLQAQESEQMKRVAQGIVNLFHDISIFVGASKISTEEDKLMAEELGCDFLLGDYLGVPVADSSFVKRIDSYFGEG